MDYGYSQKVVSAEEALRNIKNGSKIILAHAAAEPVYLVNKLVELKDEFKDIELSNVVSLADCAYTQKDMGEKLSLYDTTISSYERGNSQPDFQTILNYAEICDFEIKIINKKTGQESSIEELSKEL